MHDLIIALVFVSMVASPAIVAILPSKESEEDQQLQPNQVKAHISAPCPTR